ncbi:MAG: YabP/YqfC family sporulation protein [bacterium]|nr:YabP/YqfC family sporulation protein [bacterium]
MKIYDALGEICLVDNLNSDYVFSCGGGKCFAFSGNYKIEKFLDNEVIINLSKKRHIVVLGEGLKIATLAPKELGISGEINSINIEEN